MTSFALSLPLPVHFSLGHVDDSARQVRHALKCRFLRLRRWTGRIGVRHVSEGERELPRRSVVDQQARFKNVSADQCMDGLGGKQVLGCHHRERAAVQRWLCRRSTVDSQAHIVQFRLVWRGPSRWREAVHWTGRREAELALQNVRVHAGATRPGVDKRTYGNGGRNGLACQLESDSAGFAYAHNCIQKRASLLNQKRKVRHLVSYSDAERIEQARNELHRLLGLYPGDKERIVYTELLIARLYGVLVAREEVLNLLAFDENELSCVLLQLWQVLPISLQFFFECHNIVPGKGCPAGSNMTTGRTSRYRVSADARKNFTSPRVGDAIYPCRRRLVRFRPRLRFGHVGMHLTVHVGDGMVHSGVHKPLTAQAVVDKVSV